MNILAIDTALAAASACVLAGGETEPVAGETLLMERGHAEALLPLIDRVMARVPGGFAALGRVGVTVGPGSFTGIRVGVAAARAIGLACAVPVVGVSVLACLAAPLADETQAGIAVAAIDARHGNVFFQPFAPDGQALAPARLAGHREALRSLGTGPFRLVGSGARAMALDAASLGLRAEVLGGQASPEIVHVARLGLAADPDSAPARPLYLKAPDAHPPRDGRVARA